MSVLATQTLALTGADKRFGEEMGYSSMELAGKSAYDLAHSDSLVELRTMHASGELRILQRRCVLHIHLPSPQL